MIHIESDQVVPRVIELFESTCVKQFESLNHEILLVDADSDGPIQGDAILYAKIGAQSDDLAASLTISVPKAALEMTIPDLVKGLGNYEDFLDDWNLELANRLMGRLKNKLISHECILQMGIPEHCDHTEASAHEAQPGEAVAYHYQVGAVEFRCHLNVEMRNPEMTMDDHEDEDEDWFDESELEHL